MGGGRGLGVGESEEGRRRGGGSEGTAWRSEVARQGGESHACWEDPGWSPFPSPWPEKLLSKVLQSMFPLPANPGEGNPQQRVERIPSTLGLQQYPVGIPRSGVGRGKSR